MEANEYKRIYDEVYENDPEYGLGHGTHLSMLIGGWLSLRHLSTHVDCGGGRHQFCEAVSKVTRAMNCTVRTYSLDIHAHVPVPALVRAIQAPLWDLSGVPTDVDAITCFDTLEHLAEEDIERTIKAWYDKLKPGGQIYLTIHTRPAITPAPEGIENLHLTIKPLDWWKEQFEPEFIFIENNHDILVAVKRDNFLEERKVLDDILEDTNTTIDPEIKEETPDGEESGEEETTDQSSTDVEREEDSEEESEEPLDSEGDEGRDDSA